MHSSMVLVYSQSYATSPSSIVEDLQTTSWTPVPAGRAGGRQEGRRYGEGAPVFQHRVTTVPAVVGSCSSSLQLPGSSQPSFLISFRGTSTGTPTWLSVLKLLPALHSSFEDFSRVHGNSKDVHFHTAEHCHGRNAALHPEPSLTKTSQWCPMKEMQASLCAKISQQPITAASKDLATAPCRFSQRGESTGGGNMNSQSSF